MGLAFRVSEIQATPNPNAIKFVLDRKISEATASFFDAASAKQHPIASRLFEISGVSSVLLLGDFVTINRVAGADWKAIKAKVKTVLATV